MSKISILQNGVIKTIPVAHAKILVALKKATYVPEPEVVTEEGGKEVDTNEKPKRAYLRKDLRSEG